MTQKTAKDFHPAVLGLFDKFVHGDISRRDFLNQAAKYTVAGVSASSLLASLTPRFAQARQIEESDVRIKADYIEIDSP